MALVIFLISISPGEEELFVPWMLFAGSFEAAGLVDVGERAVGAAGDDVGGRGACLGSPMLEWSGWIEVARACATLDISKKDLLG